MGVPKIAQVRAYTVAAKGGADYHDQEGYHWIDDHIATPMSKYPGYADSRQSFGINVLGTLVVEVEATDGTVGFGVTTAGEIGAWIVEKHLARFLEGAQATDVERIWDQMYLSTLFYGRKGIVLNAISAVDLALYDLLGRSGRSRSTSSSAGRSGTSCSSTPPGPGRTTHNGSASSAARCHCTTARQRAKRA